LGQLSKEVAKMVLAFNLPYSGLKLMATLTDIILYQNPVDATNKMIRYKSDGKAVI
jgi:hypothetical protein